MKTKIQALAFVSTLALAGAAQAQDCSRPPEPTIPDGTAAEQQEMVETKQAVETYIKETEAYLACVEKQEKAALAEAKQNEEELPAEERNAYVKRYNAAVETMKMVAQEFNKQLKAYLKTQEGS